jgi:hypothetical protein
MTLNVSSALNTTSRFINLCDTALLNTFGAQSFSWCVRACLIVVDFKIDEGRFSRVQ